MINDKFKTRRQVLPGCWGFESAVAMGMVAYLASEAEADLVSVVWGVEDSVADSGGGFGGVLTADFLAGGVFFTAAGFVVEAFRVFMIDAVKEQTLKATKTDDSEGELVKP